MEELTSGECLYQFVPLLMSYETINECDKQCYTINYWIICSSEKSELFSGRGEWKWRRYDRKPSKRRDGELVVARGPLESLSVRARAVRPRPQIQYSQPRADRVEKMRRVPAGVNADECMRGGRWRGSGRGRLINRPECCPEGGRGPDTPNS